MILVTFIQNADQQLAGVQCVFCARNVIALKPIKPVRERHAVEASLIVLSVFGVFLSRCFWMTRLIPLYCSRLVLSCPARQNEMEEGAGGLAHLLSTAEHGVRSSNDEEIVILTQVSKTTREKNPPLAAYIWKNR